MARVAFENLFGELFGLLGRLCLVRVLEVEHVGKVEVEIASLRAQSTRRRRKTFLPRLVGQASAVQVRKVALKREILAFEYEIGHPMPEREQVAVRYDSREDMMTEEETPFIAGAMRFIGETVRRIGFGQWRYGTDLERDDPRQKQPYIRFVIGDQNLDLVPWRLIQAALEDADAIASALQAVIEMLRPIDQTPVPRSQYVLNSLYFTALVKIERTC